MTEKQKKSPAQRAQEALDVAERRVKKLDDALVHQKNLVQNYQEQLEAAKVKRDYAAKHPDLPSQEPEAAPTKSDDPVPEF